MKLHVATCLSINVSLFNYFAPTIVLKIFISSKFTLPFLFVYNRKWICSKYFLWTYERYEMSNSHTIAMLFGKNVPLHF